MPFSLLEQAEDKKIGTKKGRVMQDFAGNILSSILIRLLEPVLDFFSTSLTVYIALIAQLGFAEDEDGNVRRVKGSGTILVVNRGRESIKITEMGVILKDKTRISLNSHIAQDNALPAIVAARDHKEFPIRRELFLSLTPLGIESIKRAYIVDSMLHTITTAVPNWQKRYIEYSIYAPKEEISV
jgi:hypothetical protein